MTYKVVEKFISINGEGKKSGQVAIFIRLKGCNLACSYCDTQWANEKDVAYEELTKEDIFKYISDHGKPLVTLTGGEPLLHENIEELIDYLIDQGVRLEVETNGSIYLKKYAKKNLSLTMDYKLPSSLMSNEMLIENFKFLSPTDVVKFVVGSMEDLEYMHALIKRYNLETLVTVFISPVFDKIDTKEIVNFMIEKKLLKTRLQLQMHKLIWDPNEKGV